MTDPEFHDIFHSHKNVLHRFAYRMTGSSSAAEDIVQECFMTLWKKPDGYRANRGAIRAYLLGVARNLVLKNWRDQRPFDPLDPDGSVPPVDLLMLNRAESVCAAVQALPPLQREALVLAEYEEMSLEEIASLTGAELAAVKSRLHRARQNLRRMLAPLLPAVST